MSEKQKAFSAGALLATMFSGIILAITSWVALQASEVPVIETKLQQVNSTIDRLNKSLSKVHDFMEHHHQSQVQWSIWKNSTTIKLDALRNNVNKNDLDIEVTGMQCTQYDKDIEDMKKEIEECKDGLIATR